MNLYEFLKNLQEGIEKETENECKVGISLWEFWGRILGIRVDILFFDDEDRKTFHYCTPLHEESVGEEGFLEHYCKVLIEEVSRAFRIAKVGED